MAASKKRVAQREQPGKQSISDGADPNAYYRQNPSWNFYTCDTQQWAFTKENIGDDLWDEIVPFFKGLETRTWGNILTEAKKQNHSIEISGLNPAAQKRLEELRIEQDSLVSLRLTGKHRIYGYIIQAVFHVLWYDSDHGDNAHCVCRSYKKHT